MRTAMKVLGKRLLGVSMSIRDAWWARECKSHVRLLLAALAGFTEYSVLSLRSPSLLLPLFPSQKLMSLSCSSHSSASSLAAKRCMPAPGNKSLRRLAEPPKCVCSSSRTASPCPFCISSQSSQNADSQSTQRPSRISSTDRASGIAPPRVMTKHMSKGSVDDGKRQRTIQANSSFDIKISAMYLRPGKVIAAQPTKSTECESSSQRSFKRKVADVKQSADYSSERKRKVRYSFAPKALTKDSFLCHRSKSPLPDSEESVYHSHVEQMMIENLLTQQQSRRSISRQRSKSPYSFSVCQSRSHTPIPMRSPARKSSFASLKVQQSSSRKQSTFQSSFEEEDHRAHQHRVNSEYFPGATFDSAPTSYQTTARVFEPEDDRIVVHFTGIGHSNAVNSVCVHERTHLFAASSDYTIGRWRLPSGLLDPYKVDSNVVRFGSVCEPDLRWRAHSGRVHSIISLDKSRFCSAGDDGLLKAWHLEGDSSYVSDSAKLALGPLHFLAVSTSSIVLVASKTRIQAFDVHTKKTVASIGKEHALPITAVKFVDNAVFATASEDNSVKVWDVRSTRCVATFLGHRESVNCLSVMEDWKLASGSSDQSVRLWDLRAERELSQLQINEDVRAVCALRERLVLAGGDSLLIWEDAAVRKLRVNVGAIRCIEAVHSTSEIVTGGSEGRFSVWHLLQ